MKLSLDSLYLDGHRRRHVPIELMRIASGVWDCLLQQLDNSGEDEFVELVRIRFSPENLDADHLHVWKMLVSCTVSIDLCDLHTLTQREEKNEYLLNLPSIVASSGVANVHVDTAVRDALYSIGKEVGYILSVCKRKRIRYISGGKVVQLK